ncbi:ATP-binding protein [Streptomyces sp. NPDC001407]|uniref:ATP-binding protein n=1 Tax=Streptomyces sp. NPDC001407 TaxID=3364573 RepID=UPI0036CDA7C1
MPPADTASPCLGALLDHHAVDLDGVKAPQKLARDSVRATCSEHGGYSRDNVALVADELVGNAVRHTEHGPRELLVDVYQRGMTVGVADWDPDVTAVPARPAQRPAPPGADDDEDVPASGRGLFLIDLYSTTRTVEEHNGGKIVRVSIAQAGAS